MKPPSESKDSGAVSHFLPAKRGLPPEGLQAAAALVGPGVSPVPTHLERGGVTQQLEKEEGT